MHHDTYRKLFGFSSLLIWALYTGATWWMVALTERHELGPSNNDASWTVACVPFLFLALDLFYGWAWLNFENFQEKSVKASHHHQHHQHRKSEEEEGGQKHHRRVIDWLYPYTYFVLASFTYLLWLTLKVHERVYGEFFVDPTWNLFAVNSALFICILLLMPFYIHDTHSYVSEG